MNTISENELPRDNDDHGLGLGESLVSGDIERWIEAMCLVDEAVASLRAAQSDDEIAVAAQAIYLAASRARDYESSAAYYMRRYGYADGVNVPGAGRFRVRQIDEFMDVLEEIAERPGYVDKARPVRQPDAASEPSKWGHETEADSPDLPDNNSVSALVSGRLMEVNWANGTAELHPYLDRAIPLRFGPKLKDDMRRCATHYIQVKGQGWFNEDDKWQVIQADEIIWNNPYAEPPGLEEILNNPNPKIFRSEEIVRASEPFDVDEFARMVREERDLDIGRRELSE